MIGTEILVNGESMRLNAAETLSGLVERLGFEQRGLAIAVNGEVIARSAWATTKLRPGDAVEVLAPAQGG